MKSLNYNPQLNPRTILMALVLSVATLLVVMVLVSCKGCNKPVYIPPTPVQVIEQKHNPVIDSLKQVTAVLTDSVSKLNAELQNQKKKTSLAGAKAEQTANRLRSALNEKDTVEVLVYADDIIEEYDAYIQNTNRQDSIQEAIIEKQAATIVNNRAEIELHASKYEQLKTAYNIQEVQLSDAVQSNKKMQKKLKRSKFWNKVLGVGTAVGIVAGGILFL